jgi:hypothetical protein
MLLTVAQRSVMLVIEAPTKVINLLLREFDQRDRVYSAAVAKQKVRAFVICDDVYSLPNEFDCVSGDC